MIFFVCHIRCYCSPYSGHQSLVIKSCLTFSYIILQQFQQLSKILQDLGNKFAINLIISPKKLKKHKFFLLLPSLLQSQKHNSRQHRDVHFLHSKSLPFSSCQEFKLSCYYNNNNNKFYFSAAVHLYIFANNFVNKEDFFLRKDDRTIQ